MCAQKGAAARNADKLCNVFIFLFATALDSSADARDTHKVVVKVRRSEVRAERCSGKKC